MKGAGPDGATTTKFVSRSASPCRVSRRMVSRLEAQRYGARSLWRTFSAKQVCNNVRARMAEERPVSLREIFRRPDGWTKVRFSIPIPVGRVYLGGPYTQGVKSGTAGPKGAEKWLLKGREGAKKGKDCKCGTTRAENADIGSGFGGAMCKHGFLEPFLTHRPATNFRHFRAPSFHT